MMGYAKKCDRCGGLYVPKCLAIKTTSGSYEQINAIELLHIAQSKLYGESKYNKGTYDLCPACLDSLKEWIEQY